MFLFFHALALALSLFSGFGGGFTHVGGAAALSAPMAGRDGGILGPPDSGGTMPGGGGSGPMGSGQGGF